MAKKQTHSSTVFAVSIIAIIAIVSVSAMAMLHWRWLDTTPGFGHAPEWAGLTGEDKTDKATGGNLKPMGSVCKSDDQCESGSCSGDVYDRKGQLTNINVCI